MRQALLRRLERIEARLSPKQQWPRTLSILEQIDRARREALAPGEGIVEDWHRDLEGIIWGRERITSARGDEGSGRERSGYLDPVMGQRQQPISVRAPQAAVISSGKRFRVLVAGRRFGKTQVALIELMRAVCAAERVAWYVAPTYKQTKRIAWKRLKELARPYRPAGIYETELRIEFPWGASIALRGADNYDSLRGEGLDFVVLDEYASMAREAWTEVLRPMLADRQGGALFIGTPQGFNHFYDLYTNARDQPDWALFHHRGRRQRFG